jgi:benzoylformate decarboxylase
VIALLGDGSSLYSIQGLWSAAQLKLPITFVIVNNGRYEALRSFGRHFGLQKTEGTDLSGIDFSNIAQGQGVKAERVTTGAALDQALRTAFSLNQPMLIDAVVD